MLDEETLAELTTSLAGNVELYNKVINTFQEKEQAIEQTRQQLEETKSKLEESEARGHQYLNQISNLLSKIPVSRSEAPQSIEQKIEEIRNRAWKK